MLNRLIQQVDQFDSPPTQQREEAEKVAKTLNDRRKALENAPKSDFAVVLYNGRDQHRKFPVQTETDIRMSKEALDEREHQLPEEIVKAAKYFLDQAAREKLAEPLFEERPEKQATNTVFVGQIDVSEWEEQVEKTATAQDPVFLDLGDFSVPVQTKGQVKKAEKILKHGVGLDKEARCDACRKLASQAEKLGADLSSTSVTRYDRESLPSNFQENLNIRKQRAPTEVRPFYEELKKSASSMPLPKVARKLRRLDQVSAFAPMEGEKMAHQMSPSAMSVVFPENEPVRKEASIGKVAEVFGEDFAERYKKEGEAVLDDLNSAEKDLFHEAVNA
jgi:hypothetical protein